ncbi:MAG: OmpA family protein [Prevotella sp.]|nr:OmpA family protein [Prevotella sp.]
MNVGYAKARAEKVAKALFDKGVAKERMIVNSYGDTVQPFEENDRNRCVIVVGE